MRPTKRFCTPNHPTELYTKVCEAAFSVGDFLAVAIFLLEPETNLLRFAAGCGDDVPRLRSIDISIVAGTPRGPGLPGTLSATGKYASATIS